ncbi:MAG: hypothetical protein GY935_10705 [Gammaproteobacteria bacterium]|nr:hypothetical protein [Gammaproteobacteria bacterium]
MPGKYKAITKSSIQLSYRHIAKNIRIIRRVKLQLTLNGGWWFDTMNVLCGKGLCNPKEQKAAIYSGFFYGNGSQREYRKAITQETLKRFKHSAGFRALFDNNGHNLAAAGQLDL